MDFIFLQSKCNKVLHENPWAFMNSLFFKKASSEDGSKDPVQFYTINISVL